MKKLNVSILLLISLLFLSCGTKFNGRITGLYINEKQGNISIDLRFESSSGNISRNWLANKEAFTIITIGNASYGLDISSTNKLSDVYNNEGNSGNIHFEISQEAFETEILPSIIGERIYQGINHISIQITGNNYYEDIQYQNIDDTEVQKAIWGAFHEYLVSRKNKVHPVSGW